MWNRLPLIFSSFAGVFLLPLLWLEITHRAALCAVKNGTSHLTCTEQGEPLDGRETSSNWLRSESIRGTDPHSQARVRIAAINKYQHNIKFCIFITCPLPTQKKKIKHCFTLWGSLCCMWTSSSPCAEQSWGYQSHRNQGHVSLTCLWL